jgi:hypothetical protein
VVEVHGQIGEQRARLATTLKAFEHMPAASSSLLVEDVLTQLREHAKRRALDSMVNRIPWRYKGHQPHSDVHYWARHCDSARRRLHEREASELKRVGGTLAAWEERLTLARSWESKVLALRDFPCAAFVMQVGAQVPSPSERKRSALQGLIRQVHEQIENASRIDLIRASELLSLKTAIPEVALERRAYFDPHAVQRALGLAIKRGARGAPGLGSKQT